MSNEQGSDKTPEKSGGPVTPEVTPEVLPDGMSQGQWNFEHGIEDKEVKNG